MERLGSVETDHMGRRAAIGTAHDSVRLDVLFLLNNLAIGGSERKIVRLAGRLAAGGIRTGIACLNGPYTQSNEVSAGVPLWKLERRGKLSLDTVRALREIVERRRPAALVAVNLYPCLYVALAAALARDVRPRTIGLVNTSVCGTGRWRRRFYQALLTLIDRTVHGSEAQRLDWVARGGRAWQRSSVIYNGVDLRHFAPQTAQREGKALRRRLRIPAARFVFGTVARLAAEKNQLALIEALARLADIDAHLLIAGEGSLRTTLVRRAEELGIGPRVNLIDAASDVRPVLAALDVFVLPSIAVESFSNAALEAMAMGKPVILSDIGGAREMIDVGIEGFVLTRDGLETRLPELLATLASEPGLRRCLGAAAGRRVERNFSLEEMVSRYVQLLRQRPGESS
jgi:glycosyltransferase involved in cell wall biosynthesis